MSTEVDNLDELSDQDTTDEEVYYKCLYRFRDIKPLTRFPLHGEGKTFNLAKDPK